MSTNKACDGELDIESQLQAFLEMEGGDLYVIEQAIAELKRRRDTVTVLMADRHMLLTALQAANTLMVDVLPKFDWGDSFLGAKAISQLNDIPIQVAAALRSVQNN